MRALVCEHISNDFSRLSVREIPIPEPGPDQVRVKVRYAGLNYPDLLVCRGLYQHRLTPPFVPGMEVAGYIDKLGENVSGLPMIKPIVATMRGGGIGEFAIVDQASVHPKPGGLTLAESAVFQVAYSTAYVCLVRKADLQPGETVLIHGASGGVGLALIDLAIHLGAKVIATTGSDNKAEALRNYGASHVLDTRGGFAVDVKALTGNRGADVIIDPVGGDVFDESTHCIAFDGRLLVVGFTSGRFATVRSNIALIKGFSVIGVRAGEYARRFPEHATENRNAVWALSEAGRIRPLIHRKLRLTDAREGFRLLAERGVVGKVVIKMDGD